jgi:tyrosyl-tRNA synthetase
MAPYAFYQFWLNVSDAEVPNLLRVFSFKTRAEIEELERLTSEQPARRAGQRALAEELTTLVHGADECARAAAAGQALFGQGALEELDPATLAAAVAELNPFAVPEGDLPPIANLMASAGVVESVSAARRAIEAGGAYVNNVKVADIGAVPGPEDLLHGRYLILRRGKRTVGAVEIGANAGNSPA